MKIHDISKNFKNDKNFLEIYRGNTLVKLSFKEIYKDVMNLSKVINKLKLGMNNIIGITSFNSYEMIVLDLSLISLGIKTLYLDPIKFSYKDFDKIKNQFGICALITDEAIVQNNPSSEIICLDDLFKLKDNTENNNLPSIVKYKKYDVVTYKTSSGSTGNPKIMPAMVGGIEDSLNSVEELFSHKGQKILVVLPLHLLQQRYWIYSAILFNYDIAVIDMKFLLSCFNIVKPSVIMGVPYLYEFLYKEYTEKKSEDYNITLNNFLGGKIKYLWSGSAPISEDLVRLYQSNKVSIYHGYGTSETCIVSKNYENNNKIGSSGKVIPRRKVKILKNGEICVKLKNPLCNRYMYTPDRTNAKVFSKNGYIKTGDIGYIDDEGYLYIKGRSKNLIVLSNAKKIYPEIIEKKFESLHSIQNCCVFGNNRPYIVALFTSNPKTELHMVQLEINQVNSRLIGENKIFNFLILEKGFSMKDGTLLNQGKKNRNFIYEMYKSEIEELYNE
jgi:long-chain acyl-CoA synthetase